MKLTRMKTLPFKLMVFLLYSSHPSIIREGGDTHLVLGPLSKRLQMSKSRLVDYLTWLEQEGLLSFSRPDNNTAVVTLASPKSTTASLEASIGPRIGQTPQVVP